MRLTSVVFGIVHSNRTVVVLLHKYFSSWLSTFCNSISIIMNCTYAIMSGLTLWHMSIIHSPFPGWLSRYNFSPKLIVFCLFFTWIALGDVDLHFSLVSVRKTSAVKEETTGVSWLYNQCNQSIHVTDGLTAMSLLLASNRR